MYFQLIDYIVQGIILALIVITAIAAVIFKDLLAAALASAAMSLLLSVEFYMLHAPDVAIAEAAVGGGVTTALLVLGISKTERYEEEVKPGGK